MQTHNPFTISPQQLIPALLLTGLLFLAYLILSEFFLTLIWVFILVYVTRPVHQWLENRIHDNNICAAIMTALLALTMLIIVFWFATLLHDELKDTYKNLVHFLAKERHPLPKFISNIPWLGTYLQGHIDQLSKDPIGLTAQLTKWGQQGLRQFAGFIGGIGSYTIKTGVLLVTVFFFYRDGKKILTQLQDGVIHYLGDHRDKYLQAIGETTKAVVYGFILAAMVQGCLVSIGLVIAGVQAPVLLGATTALLALVPFGATLVWVPVGITLLLENSLFEGIGILLWGLLVVSTIDNVVRPLVISGASKIPFLVVMFGVLGGLHAFGIIGLFLGPIILAVLLAVWQAWLTQLGKNESDPNKQ